MNDHTTSPVHEHSLKVLDHSRGYGSAVIDTANAGSDSGVTYSGGNKSPRSNYSEPLSFLG